jgi:hypothetical protein
MTHSRERLVRVSPGVYRRGDKYVVRLRDANGRRRQVTTGTRMEAEHVKRLAQIERQDRWRRARLAAAVLATADVAPADLAELRWDHVAPDGRRGRSKRDS